MLGISPEFRFVLPRVDSNGSEPRIPGLAMQAALQVRGSSAGAPSVVSGGPWVACHGAMAMGGSSLAKAAQPSRTSGFP